MKWKEGALILPFIASIVFTGVYPKPMLDRIQPSVKTLIEHVEDKTGYVEPQPSPVERRSRATEEHG